MKIKLCFFEPYKGWKKIQTLCESLKFTYSKLVWTEHMHIHYEQSFAYALHYEATRINLLTLRNYTEF